ncbi:hypothetical protein Kpol_1013p68 [Vanderwaltozyma polyspora DSM 70294]|uniref:Carboxymuconolactone decarboxylase-like domain-containing protein n=1 Tax=Vanderwaltozyma polyspora (strain ATCC 22028 / DSM 70294 / BCRC 21397 / CBS 2163 / NBRC 10782 / NRRL Y-8283 / UCD 57-17) TaxID=436907 RepID=A7THB2_VANPO|nr:uncharacterized protein Kpol_1013p68 [Vanderwaltozyma polyspora DSM 70294]EDO18393.1 hypothetical protein Kpol_1013p68 [Vanderwaltozyma polyspora DSM 70294]
MNQILTANRLAQLSQFHPSLKDTWYLIAAVTFSVCNEPQEIPLLYHYTIMLKNETVVANQITISQRVIAMFNDPVDSIKAKVNKMYLNPSEYDLKLTAKFREAILRTGPLAGLPKAINSMNKLAEYTPPSLTKEHEPINPFSSSAHDLNTYKYSVERLKSSFNKETDIAFTTERGLKHWNKIYNKVSPKVVNSLYSAYPDLWYYTLTNVYGPLFSYDDIISSQETSLIIIAALVPQDVNPQLRGHLKGAINLGCKPETIEAVRNLAIMVAKWCGVSWKSDVVKL